MTSSMEGFDQTNGQTNGQTNDQSKNPTSIESTNSSSSCNNLPLTAFDDAKNLPLREYAIMSSFNSAYDGKAVSAQQLKEVLARGYRFIDLNVFVADPQNKGEKKVYVGFAPDNKPTLADNALLFSEAMKIIHQFAFVKTPSKKAQERGRIPMTEKTIPQSNGTSLEDNYKEYPLFLHLRIFRAENSNVDVIQEMLPMLHSEEGTTRYYRTKANVKDKAKPKPKGDAQPNANAQIDEKAISVSGCTLLGDIKKKIIVSMDITNLLQIYTPSVDSTADMIPDNVRESLHSFVNVFTGGHTWQAFYHYEDVTDANTQLLRVIDSGKRTNIDRWFVAFPFSRTNPIRLP